MPEPSLPPAEELLGLLDGLPANVALWDREVRLRYGNRRSLLRAGRPQEELPGIHLSELVQAHAVELSAQYIEGALAGRPQQVERAMVDAEGQRYNAHQVTHIPDVVHGEVLGYCALAVDITASIEGYEQARRAREQAALRAERERIAGDIDRRHVVDELSGALERLNTAIQRVEALPSLTTVAEAIDRAIDELRARVPARMFHEPAAEDLLVAYPRASMPFDPGSADVPPGVDWPADITGAGWSAEQVCALLDLLPAAVAIWDPSFGNVFANRAAVRWFGRSGRADVVGRSAGDLLGPAAWAVERGPAQAALAGEPQQFDRTVAHPSGLRHLQVAYLPRVRDGAVDAVYSFVVDVTERVDAELALQDARAELAIGRERERIADDLHNLVIQRLFAAGLVAGLAGTSPAEAQLRSVQDGIVAALDDLQAAMTTLRENVPLPDVLPALARLVHDAARSHELAVAIENVGSVEYVPPAVGAELLAAAEAALSNVVRHSGAGSVVVTVAADAATVWLRVVDDGRGLGAAPQGKGMADMAARAARLGGTCTWRPNEPSGTVLDWRVPTHKAPSVSPDAPAPA